MGSPVDSTLANASLVHHQKNGQNIVYSYTAYLLFYYRRYVNDAFVLLNSSEHLRRFQSYVNSRYVNISFTANEKYNRISSLDINITCQQSSFTTPVYRKPIFSRIYTHFDSLLTSTSETGMTHTLLHRCFQICSDESKFHLELVKSSWMFTRALLS